PAIVGGAENLSFLNRKNDVIAPSGMSAQRQSRVLDPLIRKIELERVRTVDCGSEDLLPRHAVFVAAVLPLLALLLLSLLSLQLRQQRRCLRCLRRAGVIPNKCLCRGDPA